MPCSPFLPRPAPHTIQTRGWGHPGVRIGGRWGSLGVQLWLVSRAWRTVRTQATRRRMQHAACRACGSSGIGGCGGCGLWMERRWEHVAWSMGTCGPPHESFSGGRSAKNKIAVPWHGAKSSTRRSGALRARGRCARSANDVLGPVQPAEGTQLAATGRALSPMIKKKLVLDALAGECDRTLYYPLAD
eukprot:scaffold967_cov174-Isochrysis_galbana.AAC.1